MNARLALSTLPIQSCSATIGPFRRAVRTVLKRAAAAGNARAALELGMTFDQAFLNKWGVVGFDPDLAQACEWYDRAIKLGSTRSLAPARAIGEHAEVISTIPKVVAGT